MSVCCGLSPPFSCVVTGGHHRRSIRIFAPTYNPRSPEKRVALARGGEFRGERECVSYVVHIAQSPSIAQRDARSMCMYVDANEEFLQDWREYTYSLPHTSREPCTLTRTALIIHCGFVFGRGYPLHKVGIALPHHHGCVRATRDVHLTWSQVST